MKKISIIYYSETGNTEIMAKAIAEGSKNEGGEVTLINGEDASKEDIINADIVALGSPAMASEQLQVTMEYYVDSIKDVISEKPVALFGSYDWGDGMWLRDWEEDTRESGANIVAESLMIHLTPEEDGLITARTLGETLAKA